MTSISQGCFLNWNEHSNNFSLAFNELLQGDELVDVKLVAEGHLISAHRLILSAMSPYFRDMFTQMPVNQQAFVFLKDISKQTVTDLIIYIYCGEVNVKLECLEEFMNAAQALNIKGLPDGNYSQPFDLQQPNSTRAEPTYNGSVYQTPFVNHPFKSVGVQYQSVQRSAQSTNYRRPMNEYQKQNEFNFVDKNETTGGFDVNNSNNDQIHEDGNSGNNFTMGGYDDHFETGPNDSNQLKETASATRLKRTKPNNDQSEYNIVADVRINDKGGPNLFHSDQKFNKHGKSNGYGQQRWICTRVKSRNCRAAASTMDVNGATMMKILMAEHTHVD